MSLVQIADILFARQRRLFVTVLVAALAATVAATMLSPREYEAKAMLFLGDDRPADAATSEALARSYGTLLGTPTVAREVARVLGPRTVPAEITSRMKFRFLTATRLIEITATDRSPQRAATLANAYATTFVRSGERLTDGTTVRRPGVPRPDSLTVASRAVAPSAPVRPKPLLYLALGLFVGVALAVGAALLRNAFDQRVFDESEIAALLDAPVLARIPEAVPFDAGENPTVRAALNFLDANLHADERARQVKTIVLTSATMSSGKSTILVGLARLMAQQRRRVVVVEADLRNPKLPARLGMRDPRRGLAELLEHGGDPHEVLKSASGDVRVVGPGRPLPDDPAGLFRTPNVVHVLSALATDADHVLIATPPILAAPETSVLSTLADAVVFVVDVRTARRDLLAAAREQLARCGAELVGIVLNRASMEVHGDYEYFAAPATRASGRIGDGSPRVAAAQGISEQPGK